MFLLDEPLRHAVTGEFLQYLVETMLPPLILQLAQLGEESVTVGALSLAKKAARQTPL